MYSFNKLEEISLLETLRYRWASPLYHRGDAILFLGVVRIGSLVNISSVIHLTHFCIGSKLYSLDNLV